jgi:putative transposase
MTIRNELIDELLAGQDPSSVMRQDGLLGELKKALLNRLMAAEFDHHLAEERASGEGRNHRNGSTRKRVLTDDSHVEVTIPRDREARFDPVLIGKYQRRLPGFDDKVISLYTRGMSTREIQGHLEEIYGAEVSPQLISAVTDAVTTEAVQTAGTAVSGDVLRRDPGQSPRPGHGVQQGGVPGAGHHAGRP